MSVSQLRGRYDLRDLFTRLETQVIGWAEIKWEADKKKEKHRRKKKKIWVLPEEYTGSSPFSTLCLVLQWIHVPASVPEAFWDEFHTIST